jgi:hypothetical protein
VPNIIIFDLFTLLRLLHFSFTIGNLLDTKYGIQIDTIGVSFRNNPVRRAKGLLTGVT